MSSDGRGYQLCISPHYAWVQKVFSAIPGARGYLAREKRREADILIRRYAASKLDEAVAEVEAARQAVAIAGASMWLAAAVGVPVIGQQSTGGLQNMLPALSELAARLRRLSSSILYADSGWAPVSSIQAVREAELEKLCSYDDTMVGLAESILVLAKRLRSAIHAGNATEAQKLFNEITDAVTKLEKLYEERKAWLTFANSQPQDTKPDTPMLTSARSTLTRLARMLGLKP